MWVAIAGDSDQDMERNMKFTSILVGGKSEKEPLSTVTRSTFLGRVRAMRETEALKKKK